MTIDFYSQFGRLVRAHRCRNRLTQQQLSKRLKMSRASIANIELGRQKIPLHQWF
ncbi:MAG: helix-turn-helix domain-containing protein, partial [Nitrospirae bacterium]|nr:helix-turn-helix domain-containing protein [Nitrospirota bacterium]